MRYTLHVYPEFNEGFRVVSIMADLTPRQIEILKKIITEHTNTASPVGSDIIDKKYNLGICPATVRNEMVQLAKKGYLNKSHFSSGRIPTSKAFRFYIQNLMEEKELSTAEEVAYKSDIWDNKDQLDQLLYNAAKALSQRTQLLAVTTTNNGTVYYSGLNHILDQKEFWDMDFTRNFFTTLDKGDLFSNIMTQFERLENEILCLLGGDDYKNKELEECASVFGMFSGKNIKGTVGVMGPKRMQYEIIIPNVKYFSGLIQNIIDQKGY